jgi:predicted RNA-binding Zn ribbon-like protein
MMQQVNSMETQDRTKSNRETLKFELIAGNVALDFVNTLDNRPGDNPTELLSSYRNLAQFAAQTGVLTAKQAQELWKRSELTIEEAEKALFRARKLREAMHSIFFSLIHRKAPPLPAMDLLNAELHDAARHLRLVQRGRACEWRFADLTSSFHAMLWPIARAAGDLLVSSDLAMVRACSSPTCQWFFLDTSKNHHRRWCSMKLCGNRTKVRRFYAKQKA